MNRLLPDERVVPDGKEIFGVIASDDGVEMTVGSYGSYTRVRMTEEGTLLLIQRLQRAIEAHKLMKQEAQK